jgi:hypothetical protein
MGVSQVKTRENAPESPMKLNAYDHLTEHSSAKVVRENCMRKNSLPRTQAVVMEGPLVGRETLPSRENSGLKAPRSERSTLKAVKAFRIRRAVKSSL